MEAPLAVILEMVKVVLSNTLGTLSSLFQLFGSLSRSLSAIGGMGPLGFAVAALVLGLVLFFLFKFFLRSWKLIILLFVAGLVVIWMLMAGAG